MRWSRLHTTTPSARSTRIASSRLICSSARRVADAIGLAGGPLRRVELAEQAGDLLRQPAQRVPVRHVQRPRLRIVLQEPQVARQRLQRQDQPGVQQPPPGEPGHDAAAGDQRDIEPGLRRRRTRRVGDGEDGRRRHHGADQTDAADHGQDERAWLHPLLPARFPGDPFGIAETISPKILFASGGFRRPDDGSKA